MFKVDTKLVRLLAHYKHRFQSENCFFQTQCQKRTLLRACAQNQKILEYAVGTKYLVMQLFVHLKAAKQLTQTTLHCSFQTLDTTVTNALYCASARRIKLIRFKLEQT